MNRQEKEIWSTQDIADEIGTDETGEPLITRQAVHKRAVKAKIKGDRVKRYRKQYRYYNRQNLRDYCAEERQELLKRPVLQVDPGLEYSAKQSASQFMEADADYRRRMAEGMKAAHALGRALVELKDDVPRGMWKTFLVSNLPEFGRTPAEIVRKARMAMALFSANQNVRDPRRFDKESVRKFWIFYTTHYAAN